MVALHCVLVAPAGAAGSASCCAQRRGGLVELSRQHRTRNCAALAL